MRSIKPFFSFLLSGAIFILISLSFFSCKNIPGNKLSNESVNTSGSQGIPAWSWDFDRWQDQEGWYLPGIINGGVTGGSLWIKIQTGQYSDHEPSWKDQVWAPYVKNELISPPGLSVDANEYTKIIIRLRNLSPETDGIIRWRTMEKPCSDTGSVRFTMKPDCKDWQDVICHMDKHWKGIIDQIKIQPARMWQRGDIWIDRIVIIRGEIKEVNPRPDICSENVVPQIQIPGISTEDFRDAFKVLDECLIIDTPVNGFNYPVMSPGGAYGENWWQLDASLCVAGAKWVNQKFVEDIMRGFAEVQAQNPDGRIDLWGGSPVRGQAADVSSIPKYFGAAYDVARRSNDLPLHNIIFETMKNYLGYWFSPKKRDSITGLITGVFEETLSTPHHDPGILAPVDLNVEVASGCYNTGLIADYLGEKTEAIKYFNDFKQLSTSINKYLWNEEDQIYYNYNVIEKNHNKTLICTTFDPFILHIAPPERIEKLIPVLMDSSLFNWGIHPVTTIARTEPGYCEATGHYDGTAWFGDIWTLRNLVIINGLEDAGMHEPAAELIWSTIMTFNANYCEYVVPSTGSGEGVQRYGWTASQYIQAIIEHLFGIDYDILKKRLRIVPHIPSELMNNEISISNLTLPSTDNLRLDLKILLTDDHKANIDLTLTGELPDNNMIEVGIPSTAERAVQAKNSKGKILKPVSDPEGLKNVTCIQMKMKKNIGILFE